MENISLPMGDWVSTPKVSAGAVHHGNSGIRNTFLCRKSAEEKFFYKKPFRLTKTVLLFVSLRPSRNKRKLAQISRPLRRVRITKERKRCYVITNGGPKCMRCVRRGVKANGAAVHKCFWLRGSGLPPPGDAQKHDVLVGSEMSPLWLCGHQPE